MMMSHCCQPSASISAREVGKNGAEAAPTAVGLGNTGSAAGTPRVKSDFVPEGQQNPGSSQVDRNVDLRILALNQKREDMAGPSHLPLEFRNRGYPRSVDSEHDIAGLQSG